MQSLNVYNRAVHAKFTKSHKISIKFSFNMCINKCRFSRTSKLTNSNVYDYGNSSSFSKGYKCKKCYVLYILIFF